MISEDVVSKKLSGKELEGAHKVSSVEFEGGFPLSGSIVPEKTQ